jgi:hypothetical protein
MEVLEVVDSGCLARWNATPGNARICKGDRIVSIGGKEDIPSIQKQLQTSSISVCFERWLDVRASSGVPEPSNGAAMGQFSAPQAAPMGMPHMGGLCAPPATPAPASMTPPVMASPAPAPMPGNQQPSRPLGAPQFSAAPLAAKPFASPGVAQPVSVPVPVPAGNSFPWLPVLALLCVGVVVVVGVMAGDAPASPEKQQVPIPPEAKIFLDNIHPELYVEIAGVLLLLGLLMTLNFIRNEFWENSMPGYGAGMLQQVCGAAVASTLLGFGSFFMLAWAGVYA